MIFTALIKSMNTSVFSQAVDKVFPLLDEETRDEIKSRVIVHMMEFLKEKVFANDREGLTTLEQQIKAESIIEKRQELYLKQIFKKFNTLPEDEQIKLDDVLDTELTRVMQEIYQAYE